VASLSDRIALMYAGSVVEIGPRAEILRRPFHPYTQGLLRLARASMVAVPDARRHFATISVRTLDARSSGTGCRFEPQCSERMAVCGERVPREVKQGPARSVTCFKYGE
jgi:peptide/nickel transport system ATP-binding protein